MVVERGSRLGAVTPLRRGPMIRVILAFVFGFTVAASLAWAWGHTPTDQLRHLNDQLQQQENQRMLDKAFAPFAPPKPC